MALYAGKPELRLLPTKPRANGRLYAAVPFLLILGTLGSVESLRPNVAAQCS